MVLSPWGVSLFAALIKIGIALGAILFTVPMLVWLERKLVADIQARIGPNRVGPFGLLQSFADGIKLLGKESILPSEVDKLLFFAAPIVVMIPALAVAAAIPFGGDLQVGNYVHHMIIASAPTRAGAKIGTPDMPAAILFVLALTSLGVYGIVLSGWSSNNKYSLLGGLRSAAQMVSYELPMGLSVLAALMIASARAEKTGGGESLFGLGLRQVVDAQAGWFLPNWTAFNPRFAFLGFLAMIAFYICGLAETNRAPFDLPEAETELVGGYHTEYSGMKFAMFFLAEYAAMLNIAAITTTLFLGGWHAPYPDTLFLPANSFLYMLQGMFWFCAKIFLIIVLYIWIRGTLPRLRYDRLMGFSWKVLLPATLLNLFLIATVLTVFFPSRAPVVLLPPAAASSAPAPGPGPAAPGNPLPGVFGGLVPPNAPAGNTPGNAPVQGIPNAPAGTRPGNAPAVPTPAPANTPAPGSAPGVPALNTPAGAVPGGATTTPAENMPGNRPANAPGRGR
jgi:NADH-quinone oxidoreductase subunit H